ncbi:MAG: hypothetical protein M0Z65_03510 [Firmicutes bacterium]|nr:hypothetical protein [Bacillota bacterium]
MAQQNDEFEKFGRLALAYLPALIVLGIIFYPSLTFGILGAVWDQFLSVLPFQLDLSVAVDIDISGVIETIQTLSLILIGIILAAVVYYMVFNYRHAEYAEILPPSDHKIDPRKIQSFQDQLHGLRRPWYKRFLRGRESFDFYPKSTVVEEDDEGNPTKYQIVFRVRFPKERLTGLKNAVATNFPGAEFRMIPREEFLSLVKDGYGGRLVKTGEHDAYPLKQFYKESEIGDILYNMGEEGSYMIRLVPVGRRKIHREVRKALRKLKSSKKEMILFGSGESTQLRRSDMPPDRLAKLESLYKLYKGREKYFEAYLYIWNENPVKEFAEADAQSLAVKIAQTLDFDAGVRMKRILTARRFRMMLNLKIPIPFPHHRILMNTRETANLIHFPEADHPIHEENRVMVLPEGSRWLEPGELDSGVPIGNSMHPRQRDRKVKVSYEQLTKHFFMPGKTGTGKTSTLAEMLQGLISDWVEDRENTPGFTSMEPAGDFSANLLSRIKKTVEDAGKNWEDFAPYVHYIELSNHQFPVGMNLLHVPDGVDEDTVVENTVEVIKYASENKDTPQMDRFLKPTVKTLLTVQGQKHSILGIQKMLEDEGFRERVVPYINHHPILRDFWKNWDRLAHEGKGLGKLDSLINRLSPFRTTDTMRRIVGQFDWALEVKKYMEEGHIVIINANGFPSTSYKLLGGILANHFHWAAQRRAVGSKPHLLLIDECQTLQIPILQDIIAEDRKFGLCLGLATQYPDRLESWLVEAIRGNVGTILSCAVGDKGANMVQSITNGAFSTETLMSLPERTVAVYTSEKVEGRSEATQAIVQSGIPHLYKADGTPADYDNKKEFQATLDWARKVIGYPLQERDGSKAKEIDREIQRYLQGNFDESEGKPKEPSNDESDQQKGTSEAMDNDGDPQDDAPLM